jgi:hypothetical protein
MSRWNLQFTLIIAFSRVPPRRLRVMTGVTQLYPRCYPGPWGLAQDAGVRRLLVRPD